MGNNRLTFKQYAKVVRQSDARLHARYLRRRYGMSHKNIVVQVSEIWNHDIGRHVDGLLAKNYYAVEMKES